MNPGSIGTVRGRIAFMNGKPIFLSMTAALILFGTVAAHERTDTRHVHPEPHGTVSVDLRRSSAPIVRARHYEVSADAVLLKQQTGTVSIGAFLVK